MTDHYSEAIQAAAEAIHEAGWTCEAHEPLGLEACDQCAIDTPELVRKVLTALFESLDTYELADVISGWPIGSGYYSAQIVFDEAQDIAQAVKEWLAEEGHGVTKNEIELKKNK